jgi:hypothetical protein
MREKIQISGTESTRKLQELSGAMKALEKQNQSEQLRHQHALLLAQTSLA